MGARSVFCEVETVLKYLYEIQAVSHRTVPRTRGVDPRPISMTFVEDKSTLSREFSAITVVFTCQYHSISAPY